MTIKDRGNIKWTSLMLVEHREALKKLIAAEGDQPGPQLDEQALNELDYLLQTALYKELPVKITYYQGKRYYQVTGRIKSYLTHRQQLVVLPGDGSRKLLQLKDIIALEITG